MNEKVEMQDVQGIIIKGYGRLEAAKYVLLQIHDVVKAKLWLSDLSARITPAHVSSKSFDTAINIAFTFPGIKALEFSDDVLKTFPLEFREGMVTEHRQRVLGDFGEANPENWIWGGPKDSQKEHILLMLFALDEVVMDTLINSEARRWEAASLKALHILDTSLLPSQKEHFGFRDGIAQPVMRNADRNESAEHQDNLINPGEFLFGYKNEYDKYTFSPNVPADADPENLLQPDKNVPHLKDLGRNGSMLVYRQLHQDVKKFWTFVENAALKQALQGEAVSRESVAAKMLGRWPNGAPLTKCPIAPDDRYIDFDKFGYAKKDFDGYKCPVGAHIRRANPRDNFLRNSTGNTEKDIEKSLEFMKRFRILRRGRPYGPPISPTMNPEEMLKTEDGQDRGMHFICFNSNISRQFELIQQTWINNPKFAGLYEDPDPIASYPQMMGEDAADTFTIQAEPVRKKIDGLPRFVLARGGGYFFMPGIMAIKFMTK